MISNNFIKNEKIEISIAESTSNVDAFYQKERKGYDYYDNDYILELKKLRDENQLLMRLVKQQEAIQLKMMQRIDVLETKVNQQPEQTVHTAAEVKPCKIERNITYTNMNLRAIQRLNYFKMSNPLIGAQIDKSNAHKKVIKKEPSTPSKITKQIVNSVKTEKISAPVFGATSSLKASRSKSFKLNTNFSVNIWSKYNQKVGKNSAINRANLDQIELEEYNRIDVYSKELIENTFNCRTIGNLIKRRNCGYCVYRTCSEHKDCKSTWNASINILKNEIKISEYNECIRY